VQLSAQGVKVSKALQKVRSLATHTKSLRLASLGVKIRLAAEAMSGSGNAAFKQVLGAIDAMIAELRKEGQDDIDHRDRCQRSLNGNSNENEDLATRIEKLKTEITRLNGVKEQLATDIETTQGEIEGVEGDMEAALNLRNEDHEAHQKAAKADREAVSLLTKAIAALAKFYDSNKIALAQQPAYTTSEDDAPETTFKDANYGGRKSENTGIVAILGMIKEDVEKEMATAAKEEAESLAAYTQEKQSMQDSHDALSQKKANLETQEADTADTIADKEAEKAGTEGNKGAAEDEKAALETSCAWVETHFDTRADKRKNEIAGLQDAKSYLMGAEP
jgi:chromosome segregation ATPase